MRSNLPAILAAAMLAACASAPDSSADPAETHTPPRPAPPLTDPIDGVGDTSRAIRDTAPVDEAPGGDAPGAQGLGPAAPASAGWIAGRALPYEEIVEEWHRIAPREVFLIVEKLIASRMGEAEAARLGIRLDPKVVQAEFDAQEARFRADIAADAPGVSVNEFIREVMGVEPARYWERIREGVTRQMLVERAVRAWALESENAAVRLIVVATAEEARDLADRLAAGEDFAELAAAHSLDESGEVGGLIPYLVRQEHSPLARITFAAEVGEIVGPVTAAGHQFLVRVEERRSPLGGGWPALAEPVEASLRAFPVEESEFTHWKLSMEQRYEVDLEPLLARIGAPERRDR